MTSSAKRWRGCTSALGARTAAWITRRIGMSSVTRVESRSNVGTASHYLPREVFFGRFGLPFLVAASGAFGCGFAGFLPAITDSSRQMCAASAHATGRMTGTELPDWALTSLPMSAPQGSCAGTGALPNHPVSPPTAPVEKPACARSVEDASASAPTHAYRITARLPSSRDATEPSLPTHRKLRGYRPPCNAAATISATASPPSRRFLRSHPERGTTTSEDRARPEKLRLVGVARFFDHLDRVSGGDGAP
jgi:hypothetical protein